jgi:transcriptional regulator with XRE-family HTH domain
MGRPPRTPKTTSESIEQLLMTVATRLKDARLRLKLTQKQVADQAELQQSYIYEIEAGGTNLTLRTLAKLAEVLKLDIRTLFPASDGLAPSAGTDEALHIFIEKILVFLRDCQKQDAERHQRQAELLGGLETILRMRKTVATPATPEPMSLAVEVHATKAESGGAKRAGPARKPH